MVINTNTSAQSSARLLSESSSMLAKSLARLSSGAKITSPEDDAAGMAVSMRFDAQINRITAAKTIVNNAVSYAQTQDGYMKKVAKALDRMSELSVLSQDVTKSPNDLVLYDAEFQKLSGYIQDLFTKEFNGVALFDGGTNATRAVVVDSEGETYDMDIVDGSVYTNFGDVTTATNAATALTTITGFIQTLATDRATVGANISALTSYSDQLAVLKDNLSAANSRIKDVDVAEESTNFARYNILVQSGTAMLAQANSVPSSALRLLS